ncbi:LamG-like jellyroll fold domain-containing protein [Tautonia marina]|uniref:LamG-like jellyroll fold domain-containing protein n=1 Tax=Tautonia marina TaxID=2653855 RepID=UPI001260F750|nr:LamG-like jellyroll fold domain-containing protein [Tautonia marina]
MRIRIVSMAVLALGIGASVRADDGASPSPPAPGLVDGRFGQALDARKGGTIAPADDRFEQRPLTVELWTQLLDREAGAVLLSHEAPTSGSHWELVILPESADLAFRAPGLSPAIVTADGPIGDGQWHHVALLLESNRVRVVVDGELRANEEVEDHPNAPPQRSGLAVGTRIEDRRPNAVLIDDVRISSGLRDVVTPPSTAFVTDEQTIVLWNYDESEAEYLARWTPGGETNQRGLPYPHKFGAYEFQEDPDWIDGRWQGTDKGPFVSHSTQIPQRQLGPKTFTLFLGPDRSTTAVFDLERCGIVAGMTQSTWKTDSMRFGLLRKPTLEGSLQSYVSPGKLWRTPPSDSHPDPQPVDPKNLDYQGLRLHENQVVLMSRVLGGTVIEACREARQGDVVAVARMLKVDGLSAPAWLTLAEWPVPADVWNEESLSFATATAEDGTAYAIAVRSDLGTTSLVVRGGDVCLPIGAGTEWSGEVFLWSGPAEQLEAVLAMARSTEAGEAIEELLKPGPRRWGDPIVTTGTIGADDGQSPYVIDTVTVPYENPFQALFFITAIDFFPDGSAAVATAHGDVWIVRGLDRDLQAVSWQRFATGLYQPLGLKVVNGSVIVLGRDQLTKLVDENEDGEADRYESFNHDLVIQGLDHAYAMRLETDIEGNYYFLKSGAGPHGSALIKVSADGSELSVVARGFRHPYGMGIGPDNQITVADNEGNWVPSSKIDLIREGGFYGYLAGAPEAPEGVVPDPPLCYIPKAADNSSGGQVWYTGDRWGDYHQNGMLHLSWGRCTLHAVLQEVVDGIHQAATVRFPGLTFLSGSGEAVFHPIDGQLYVVGLNGWQTGAAADGSLQRVRYTGRPIHMPAALQVYEDGLLLSFSEPIDAATAADVKRYRAEQWNYRWSSIYGSFHYSASDPARIGHDPVTIQSAEPQEDGRSVFLRIDGLKPIDQFWLSTDLVAEDQSPLRFDLYATIHALRASESRSP